MNSSVTIKSIDRGVAKLVYNGNEITLQAKHLTDVQIRRVIDTLDESMLERYNYSFMQRLWFRVYGFFFRRYKQNP